MPVCSHARRFPPGNLRWKGLILLLGPAPAEIARFGGLLAAVPNPHVLINPLGWREAQLSSCIEGAQASIGEVLQFQAREREIPEQRRENAREFLNCHRVLIAAERFMVRSACGY